MLRLILVAYFVAFIRLSKSWIGATVNIAILVGFYFVGLIFVEYLKKASGDYACHSSKVLLLYHSSSMLSSLMVLSLLYANKV